MIITLKGYASMRRYLKELPSNGEMDLPEGTRVKGVLNRLKIPVEEKKVVLVNGRPRSEDYALHAGDTLVFFPPLEGG